jgi:protein-tyrosine phosphatase
MSKILENLFLGNFNDAQNKSFLQNNNIQLVINCTEECNFDYKSIDMPNMVVYKLNFLDNPLQSIEIENLPSLLYIIDEYLKNKKGVLIHCYAGMSRSPTICAAYLIWKYRMNTFTSLEFIREKRYIISPNYGFVLQLDIFSKKLYPNNY